MRGRRNPDKPLVNNSLPPCRVCGEPGSGFHYGVTTCGACKGFFRRCIVRKEPYVCAQSSLCHVGPSISRRQTCPKCRHDKCLAVGMSKDASKVGRYSLSKKSKDMEEAMEHQNPTSGVHTAVPMATTLTSDVIVHDTTGKHMSQSYGEIQFNHHTTSQFESTMKESSSDVSCDFGIVSELNDPGIEAVINLNYDVNLMMNFVGNCERSNGGVKRTNSDQDFSHAKCVPVSGHDNCLYSIDSGFLDSDYGSVNSMESVGDNIMIPTVTCLDVSDPPCFTILESPSQLNINMASSWIESNEHQTKTMTYSDYSSSIDSDHLEPLLQSSLHFTPTAPDTTTYMLSALPQVRI